MCFLAFSVSRTPPPLEINSDKESSTVLIGDKVKLGESIQHKTTTKKKKAKALAWVVLVLLGLLWFPIFVQRHVVAVAPCFFSLHFFFVVVLFLDHSIKFVKQKKKS